MVFTLFEAPFSKKQVTEIGSYAPSTSGVYHSPYETYAPVSTSSYNISPQYSYAVQIHSPEARISTKKEDTLTTQQKVEPKFTSTSTPTSETKSSSGLSNTSMVLIAVAAIAIFAVAK